jgi:hypothetical protein
MLTVIEGDEWVTEVTGSSIARQLVRLNTLLGRTYQGATLSGFVTDILASTGWAAGTLDTPTTNILARFDGYAKWNALLKGAEQFGIHARENNTVKTVDVGAFGQQTSLVFTNVEQASPLLRQNPNLVTLRSLEILDESEEVWNKIIPIGGGEGVNQLTLQYATRTSPFTIQSATGPDGRPYYFISDASSVSTYGLSEKPVIVKEAVPLANSLAGFQMAANALYDISANFLNKHKQPLSTYSAEAEGLMHFIAGVPTFKLGEKVRLQYRGVVADSAGTRRAWKTVDQNVYIMGFEREFDEDGGDKWQFEIANVDRHTEDFVSKMAQTFESMHAINVSLKNYTFQAPYMLQRESIEAGNGATLYAKLDSNISLLHLAKLTVTVRPVRSNAKTGGAGGAHTSSGGSSHSHQISGGTSGGGSSHSHSVSGQTTFGAVSEPVGSHQVWSNVLSGASGGSTGAGTLHNHSSATTDGADGTIGIHAHPVSGGSGSEGAHTHPAGAHTHPAGAAVVVPSTQHGHSISGTTATAESSHSHGISGGTSQSESTHTHTISDHTHPLVYGIFQASAPSNPAINIAINGVDRTAALGGPFNTVNSEYTLDVTQYLQSGATEQPVRATNTITFTTSVLCDIEAILRLDLTRSALIPV